MTKHITLWHLRQRLTWMNEWMREMTPEELDNRLASVDKAMGQAVRPAIKRFIIKEWEALGTTSLDKPLV